MACMNCCGIAFVFIFAMLYMCVLSPLVMEESKHSVIKQLKDTLTLEQQNTYDRIKKERMQIYLSGYGLGLMLSALVLLVKYRTKSKQLTPNVIMCTTASISFVVNYFYYILSPKSEWMVTSLNTERQKQAWLKMYRYMQYNYHVGFAFGILGVMFMSKGLAM
tara:strand:+ start:583 stop:1071 length:489 start_codon:yes stop_codon:yes gene_type:complete